MSRAATTHIHLLNLCVMNKAEPAMVIGLLAFNAFAAFDFKMLGFWRTIADMEAQREARYA